MKKLERKKEESFVFYETWKAEQSPTLSESRTWANKNEKFKVWVRKGKKQLA